MRVRPNGVELLRAARVAIDAAILPHLADGRRDAVRAIERALAFAEDRLARDEEPTAADVTALEDARTAMRGEVLEALPDERRYDARLVAKAIAVVTRQLARGLASERREYERLAGLLGAPIVAHATSREIRCKLVALNERLAARIREGEADVGTAAHAATLAHLEAITDEALSESNPAYARRTSGTDSSRAPYATSPVPPASTLLAVWSDVPGAFVRAICSAAPPAPFAERIDAWLHLNGAVGEALCASGSAALVTQADLFGWFAHRLAANPRVPMAAVEGAHQAHDVWLAIAEASTEFCRLVLAPFRCVEAASAEAARLP